MKTPLSSPDPMDLSCRELVELATDYLEDRLPLAERTRLELHLCTCSPCRIYLRQLRDTIVTTGRIGEEDLAPGARDALLAIFRDWKRTA